jgi:CHASE2 domain
LATLAGVVRSSVVVAKGGACVSDILGGKLPAGTFRDKIVVVGATAIGIIGVRTTPFGPVFPGPEVHALPSQRFGCLELARFRHRRALV